MLKIQTSLNCNTTDVISSLNVPSDDGYCIKLENAFDFLLCYDTLLCIFLACFK